MICGIEFKIIFIWIVVGFNIIKIFVIYLWERGLLNDFVCKCEGVMIEVCGRK